MEVGRERALLEKVVVNLPERVRVVQEPLLLPVEPAYQLRAWELSRREREVRVALEELELEILEFVVRQRRVEVRDLLILGGLLERELGALLRLVPGRAEVGELLAVGYLLRSCKE